MKIFCDLDGVLCDLVAGMIPFYGFDNYEIPNHSYNFEDWTFYAEGNPFKISNNSLSNLFEDQYFWESLPKYSWSDKLLKKCFKLVGEENVFILSAPSGGASCHGKLNWLKKNYPEIGDRYILTPHKHLLAQDDAILIDDSDWKVDKFRENRGHAVLFPQDWNSNHSIKNPLKYTVDELNNLLDSYG